MAISINHATKVISVPLADLTPVSGSLYELDVDAFRKTLKGLEDDADGMVLVDTHRHNTAVTLGGVTLARTIEIINGYTVTFEDGQYAVRLVGANNNIADVLSVNQVSLRSNNSAGLIVSGSGVTAQDKVDISAQVWADKEAVDIEAIGGEADAATRLANSALTMVVQTVDTTAFAPTTTAFECNLVLPLVDCIKGRGVFWRTGTLAYHAARVNSYSQAGGRGRITVAQMPAAPANGDTFVLV